MTVVCTAPTVPGRPETRADGGSNGAAGSVGPPSGDGGDFYDEEEAPRDILALVKQRDRLGVAVVSSEALRESLTGTGLISGSRFG